MKKIMIALAAALLIFLCTASAENIPGEWFAAEERAVIAGSTFTIDTKGMKRGEIRYDISDPELLSVKDGVVKTAQIQKETVCYLAVYTPTVCRSWKITLRPAVQGYTLYADGEEYMPSALLVDASRIGSALHLTAAAYPEAACQTYTWSGSGKSVISVSADGTALIRGRGTCTLWVTSEDGSCKKKIECVVTDLSKEPYYLEVDKANQVVRSFEMDESGLYSILYRRMICSTGASGHNVPNGLYKIPGGRRRWMGTILDGIYVQYGVHIYDQIYFHSLPYTKNGRSDTMEPEEYARLGTAASHGCIRLLCADCGWIYENVRGGSYVLFMEGVRSADEYAAVRAPECTGTWDPTDDAEGNPCYDPGYTSIVP